mgnify:CR=1 FL=1
MRKKKKNPLMKRRINPRIKKLKLLKKMMKLPNQKTKKTQNSANLFSKKSLKNT